MKKDNNSSNKLGQWAVIDIETTGADANYDSIIDVGYLQFEGTKLVRSYSSLVHVPMESDRQSELSYFIQRLTGITPAQLKQAPLWKDVLGEVLELADHQLIAHNSDFEKGFLENFFKESLKPESSEEKYLDSILYLSLLHPGRSSLNLESFIQDYGLADGEVHRGYEDSVDLLKVLLIATVASKRDSYQDEWLLRLFEKYRLSDWWFCQFYQLSEEELYSLAEQIQFDLTGALEKHRQILKDAHTLQQENTPGPFSDLDFNSENIKKIFRDEKKMQELFPDYHYRASQEELSLKVGQSFKNNIHAMVQAPTGTGKTIGYLVPAALYSKESQEQVLIATGTKALQHQALIKDIPQLKKILGSDGHPKVARLIGSSNHFCELLFRQDEQEENLLSETLSFEDKFVPLYFEMLYAVNAQRSPDEVILRDDLPYVLKRKFPQFSLKEQEWAVDFRSCTGQKCPFKRDCTYIRGLREAKEADIIIGNHALTFTWPRGIPRPSHIVVDEAHKIESEATKAFSLEISQTELSNLVKSLNHLQGVGSLFYLLASTEEREGDSTAVITEIRRVVAESASMIADHLNDLPAKIEFYFKKRPRYTDLYWNESPLPTQLPISEPGLKAIWSSLESLKYIVTSLYEKLLPYSTRWEANLLEDDGQIIAFTRFNSFFGLIQDYSAALDKALDVEETQNFARSLRFHQDYGFILSSAPINIGHFLHNQLLATSKSVVFTSATLGNALGDQGVRGVEWATGYLYLASERRFKAPYFLPAAFDYKNNTRIFICDDVPDIHSPLYTQSILSKLNPLIADLNGKCLLLFSAKARFEEAREYLIEQFEGRLPLFIQGMGNSVVDDFKRTGHGILLGMEVFGEGIDVPGEALQFVYIDKIPDLRMDHVIQERRTFYERSIGNEFTDYYLSHRTRALHQKLGRLLRRETDYGAVIITDSRIKNWKGKTMGKVFQLLNPYQPIRTGLDDAIKGTREFLQARNPKSDLSEFKQPINPDGLAESSKSSNI